MDRINPLLAVGGCSKSGTCKRAHMLSYSVIQPTTFLRPSSVEAKVQHCYQSSFPSKRSVWDYWGKNFPTDSSRTSMSGGTFELLPSTPLV